MKIGFDAVFEWKEGLRDGRGLFEHMFDFIGILISIVLSSSFEWVIPFSMIDIFNKLLLLLFVDEVVDDDKSFDNLNIVDSLHKYN